MKIMKKSIGDQLFTGLKEEIIRQNIRSGEQINPKKIAEEYGVSGMPVRDALTRLANYGLVTIKPRVGFFARVFSKSEILELFEVRRLHELYSLDRYFEQLDLDEIRRLSILMSDNADKISREQFDEIDETLHDLFIVASQNQFLVQSYNRVKDLIILVRHLDLQRIDISHSEHIQIVGTILENKKASALEQLKRHLDNVRDSTVQGLTDVGLVI